MSESNLRLPSLPDIDVRNLGEWVWRRLGIWYEKPGPLESGVEGIVKPDNVRLINPHPFELDMQDIAPAYPMTALYLRFWELNIQARIVEYVILGEWSVLGAGNRNRVSGPRPRFKVYLRWQQVAKENRFTRQNGQPRVKHVAVFEPEADIPVLIGPVLGRA
jgi:hypothetical protein